MMLLVQVVLVVLILLQCMTVMSAFVTGGALSYHPKNRDDGMTSSSIHNHKKSSKATTTKLYSSNTIATTASKTNISTQSKQQLIYVASTTGTVKNAVLKAAAKSLTGSTSISVLIAKALGYVMGVGALLVYTPIIINLMKTKKADGYSTATWVFNLLGMTMACVYPFKKGFPVSTYIEILTLIVQSVGILGLICFYQDKKSDLIMYMSGFSVLGNDDIIFLIICIYPRTHFCISLYMYVYTLALSVIACGMYFTTFNAKILDLIQIASILMCNYANIPQILLTFKQKKATW